MLKGLQDKDTFEYFKNDFQECFKNVPHAMRILGAPGSPSDWRLVEVSPSEILSLLPVEEQPASDVESRLSALESAVFGL